MNYEKTVAVSGVITLKELYMIIGGLTSLGMTCRDIGLASYKSKADEYFNLALDIDRLWRGLVFQVTGDDEPIKIEFRLPAEEEDEEDEPRTVAEDAPSGAASTTGATEASSTGATAGGDDDTKARRAGTSN